MRAFGSSSTGRYAIFADRGSLSTCMPEASVPVESGSCDTVNGTQQLRYSEWDTAAARRRLGDLLLIAVKETC